MALVHGAQPGVLSSLHSQFPPSNAGRKLDHGLVTRPALILMLGSLWSWTFGYSRLISQLQILLSAFPTPPLPSGNGVLRHSKRKAKNVKLGLISLF